VTGNAVHAPSKQLSISEDSEIIAKSIELDSESYAAIGVMPSSFNYPQGTEIWTPVDLSPQSLGSRDAIAVAEIAVSLALTVGAGLLMRSFRKISELDSVPNWEPGNPIYCGWYTGTQRS
jgi:hypothetical protein